MLSVQLIFVFSIITNLTLARPSDPLPPTEIASDSGGQSATEIPANMVHGLIINFKSPFDIQLIDPVEEESESVTSKDDNSTTDSETLVRKKRSVFDIVGSALQSLRSDNWRECGRTSWGTTIYTNGIGTACFGSCPQRARCGYGSERYGSDDGFGSDSYGFRYFSQSPTITFG